MSRRQRTVVGLLMAVLVLGTGGFSGRLPAVSIARAADPSADIPGMSLPGPIASGRLGGAIYDVVYSISVAPGYVIVASLTGTTGTDFDIYLFDSTATTVLSNVGLLTKSIGLTSSESISWPSRFGGTYYIDLNGATDVQGDYRLTVQAFPDATPPTASIELAAGRASTNQLTVPVALTASDDLSGVTEMAMSDNGATYSDWQPYRASTTWTFSPGSGLRTLWVKVRNGVGLESALATATVTIDVDRPSVTGIYPPPGSTVIGLRPRFTVTFDEPMDPGTWNELGLIVQSASGTLVTGQYMYDVATRSGAFIPTLELQPGTGYIVTVGNVEDVAGNRVLATGSWLVTPIAPTGLEVTAEPKVIVLGGSARIGVTLTGAPLPTSIDVLSSTVATGPAPLTTVPISDGRASLIVTPKENTVYEFRYAGAPVIAPARAEVRMLVRRSAEIVGVDRTVVSRARVGRAVSLSAQVNSAAEGVPVSFRLYRFDTSRRSWVYAGSRGRGTNAQGRASYTWVPPSSGSYYWRVYVGSTAQYANNVSPVYRWSVGR
ncbi:MAG: Ig-like domain-containing protein [Chloroflexi bacterium]|nr:Ig-like domain-containing protein [Chloroflexota bacterium]